MTRKAPAKSLKCVAVACGALVAGWAVGAHADPLQPRQDELLYVLKQDCGSCHGLTLKGGLGPALLPDDLNHWTAGDLADVILDGVPDTPMAPWRPMMTEREALWLARTLKTGDALK